MDVERGLSAGTTRWSATGTLWLRLSAAATVANVQVDYIHVHSGEAYLTQCVGAELSRATF